MIHDDATALYRHFDADGRLLYVGIALSPLARLCEHRVASAWYTRIATIKVEWHPSREAALDAERAAIRDERPLHNVVGMTDPQSVEPVRPMRTARRLHRLSARGVEVATRTGYHADGGGLYLLVSKTGSKSWVFRYQRQKRAHELGLGSYRNVSLAQARERAAMHRQNIAATSSTSAAN